MASYIGLIRKDYDSDFGVDFPDFPGCISAGATLEEARRMAQEALELQVRGMAEDRDALPAPSSLNTIMADPGSRNAVAFLATVPGTAERSVRVSITLPEPLLRRIDAHTRNRSTFFARAAEKALAEG
jgi:predicted RNase H-like HicB family nuclease